MGLNHSSEAQSLPHPELQIQRQRLRAILQAIPLFGSGIVKPPIIDASIDSSGDEEKQSQDSVYGLRSLRDAVRRDLDVLEKFLNEPSCVTQPALSTNAPYLLSVWNEVLLAPQPVIGIWNTFSESGKTIRPRRRGQPREDGVKVDVVADGGKRWIRVNTIKNSRILAEFREIDSYLTDSEDEDEPSSDSPPTLAQTEFDNSVLRMGRSLLKAAKENPVSGTDQIPAVTMQLTRLDPTPSNEKEYDPRISQTLDILRSMRIEVRLGERDEVEVSRFQERYKPPPPRCLQPSNSINLDLSILIALVSDIPHSPLPKSPEEAEKRFTPSAQYLSWKKTRLSLYDPKSTIEDIARPSRALSNQAIQEMVKGLFQEMHDRLAQLRRTSKENGNTSSTNAAVEFWTTPEARDRCLKIVSKIGGPSEKRRAQALFPEHSRSSQEIEEAYWSGSRYPRGFISLLPIRILPSPEPDGTVEPPTHDEHGQPLSPFFAALAATCRDILAQETIPDPRTPREFPADISEKDVNNEELKTKDDSDVGDVGGDEDPDGEIQRATVMKANPRLTAHTVQSMLWGAVKGWTTLTANKTSVRAMLKEMKARRTIWERVQGEVVDADAVRPEVGALWVVDPRSLAEGMRSDFGST